MPQYTTGPEAPGLVQSSKTDRKPSHRVFVFADLVKVKAEPGSVTSRTLHMQKAPGRSDRPVTEFTPKSRKQMLERLAMARNLGPGYFITLTYPSRFTHKPQEVKRHLANFRKALLRRYPGAGAFWRMELKKRLSGPSQGLLVPHFHLLVFGLKPEERVKFRHWLKWSWWRIVGSGDRKHLKAGTQADPITTRKHATRYAAKYAAKAADDQDSTLVLFQGWNSPGRFWGWFGNLDFQAAAEFVLSSPGHVDLKRLVRAWLRSQGKGYAKRLARIDVNYGWSAFGLGDQSRDRAGPLEESTIWRMLEAIESKTASVGVLAVCTT